MSGLGAGARGGAGQPGIPLVGWRSRPRRLAYRHDAAARLARAAELGYAVSEFSLRRQTPASLVRVMENRGISRRAHSLAHDGGGKVASEREARRLCLRLHRLVAVLPGVSPSAVRPFPGDAAGDSSWEKEVWRAPRRAGRHPVRPAFRPVLSRRLSRPSSGRTRCCGEARF